MSIGIIVPQESKTVGSEGQISRKVGGSLVRALGKETVGYA